MGRHTEAVEHTIPDTKNVILDGKVEETIKDILKKYRGLMEICIAQGYDIRVKCLEDVWTSGL